MEDAARSLLDLWDVTEHTVEALGAEDWTLPLPAGACGPVDIAELAIHLTGVHYAGPDRLRAAVAAARHRAGLQLADRAAGDPVLGAQCLDMCLHAHDLTAAVGRPVDLLDHDAAAREACRLVLRMVPRLLVAAVGADDAALRLAVRGGRSGDGEARDVHLLGGAVAPWSVAPDGRAPDVVEIEPAALLLLLAGRRDPEALRADDALAWSGPAAAAFVHHARLVPQANAG